MNVGRKSILLVLLIALVATIAVAQRNDGTLRGEVTDPSGAAVVGAKVIAINEFTGVRHETTTTSAGLYTFPNLLVGRYTVRVEGATGFTPQERKGVIVNSNTVNETHFALAVGGEQQVVEVVAGAETIETTSSQISNNFTVAEVINLPSAGGSVLNLATLAPNTTSQGGGVLGSGGSIGGTRPRMNNFTIDGVDDNDQSVTGPLSTVIQDAIAEFNLVTNQFSAEYGRSAGGQFNITTKSGTNNWHGSIAHALNNRKLNAFDNLQKDNLVPGQPAEKPRYDYNNTSATIGGPIIKNRFFIFGAFQYTTEGQGATSTTVEAPTAAGLSALNGLAANSAVSTILAQFPTAPSATRTITVNGTPVQIGETGFQSPDFYNEYDYHINGDLNLARHRLSGRWLFNRYRAPNLPAPALQQFGGDLEYDVRKALFTDVWTVTDRFVNDFRFGFSRAVQLYTVPEEFANFPNVTILELSNFAIGPESNSPQGGPQNTYQFMNNMSYIRGSHNFKWGGEWRRWIGFSDFLPRSRGDWYYVDLAQLVGDYVPADFAKRGAGSGRFDSNQHALYGFFQDDWKVNNRLTVNLGLRYEWNGIPEGSRTQTLNEISNLPGVFDFRVPKSDRNNFAPRIGFALDPFGDQKWSIRGGYGVAYDVNFTNLALLQLPPQLQSEQDPDITCALPGAPAWCANYDADALPGNTGQGFLQNGGLLQVNTPPTTQADARASTGGIIVDNVAPRVQTWSLGVQRELARSTRVELRYMGTRSDLLPVQVQMNARSAFDNGAVPLTTWFAASDVPANLALTTPTIAQFTAARGRPYAAEGFLGGVTAFQPWGTSIYHAGSVDFVNRGFKGLFLRANYTWAKSKDNATNELFSSLVNPRRPQNGYNLQEDWGRSTLDIRHKLAASWTYEVPKVNTESGFLKGILHGWQINGDYIAQSGQPVTALAGVDANGNNDSAGDRAVWNPNGDQKLGSNAARVYMNTTTGATCLSTIALIGGSGTETCTGSVVGYYALTPGAGYIVAGSGAQSTAGRNTIDTLGLNNWNASIFKNTYFGEDKYVQFRAEFFNVFNHRQFSFANGGVFGLNDTATESAAFAQPWTANFLNPQQLSGGARAIQLGLRVVF